MSAVTELTGGSFETRHAGDQVTGQSQGGAHNQTGRHQKPGDPKFGKQPGTGGGLPILKKMIGPQ